MKMIKQIHILIILCLRYLFIFSFVYCLCTAGAVEIEFVRSGVICLAHFKDDNSRFSPSTKTQEILQSVLKSYSPMSTETKIQIWFKLVKAYYKNVPSPLWDLVELFPNPAEDLLSFSLGSAMFEYTWVLSMVDGLKC